MAVIPGRTCECQTCRKVSGTTRPDMGKVRLGKTDQRAQLHSKGRSVFQGILTYCPQPREYAQVAHCPQ